MKVNISLLSFLLCLGSIFPVFAQKTCNDSNVFFTVYFKDGHSYNYYSGDVVSMTYSDVDLDGNVCEDFVVQEIDLGSRVDRYYLSDIEEISFDNVNLPFDVAQYIEQWDVIHQYIDPYFYYDKAEEAFEKLKSKVEEIKALPMVSEVEFKEEELIVTLQDGTFEIWKSFPQENELEDTEETAMQRVISAGSENHIPISDTRLWVCNTLDSSWGTPFSNRKIRKLVSEFENKGVKVDYTLYWQNDKWNDADIVIYHGHGFSIGKEHYICSGVNDRTLLANCNPDDFKRIKVARKSYVTDDPTCDIFLNEKYFKRNLSKSKDKVVYMASCNTLAYMENDNVQEDKVDLSFCDVLFDKGAKAYFGYNRKSCFALWTANKFLVHIMEDQTVHQAIQQAIKDAKKKTLEDFLLTIYKDDQVKDQCYMHSRVSTLPPEKCAIGESKAVLGVEISNKNIVSTEFSEVGILYGNYPTLNLNNSKKCKIYFPYEGVNTCQTDKLEFEKEYYYTAYAIKDGVLYTDKVYQFFTKDVALRSALRDLYNQTDGNSWKNNENWLNEKVPLDQWYGISTSSDGYNISFYNNNLRLTKVELNQLPNVRTLRIVENDSEPFTLKLHNCNSLYSLSAPLTIKVLELKNCPKLSVLPSIREEIEEIYLDGCSSLKNIECNFMDNLKTCKIENCSSLKSLSVSYNKNLRLLSVENCVSLESLKCEESNLTEIMGLGSCISLKELFCQDNRIHSLEIHSHAFERLFCYNNPITMAYEELPNSQNLYIYCDSLYNYAEVDQMYTPLYYYLEEGYKILTSWTNPVLGTTVYLVYKSNEEGYGFYHMGEPSKEAYFQYYSTRR